MKITYRTFKGSGETININKGDRIQEITIEEDRLKTTFKRVIDKTQKPEKEVWELTSQELNYYPPQQ